MLKFKSFPFVFAAIVAAALSFFAGRKSVRPETITTVRIDTLTITKVRVDTITRWRTKTAYLPMVDTITLEVRDTVLVEVPIDRYVAEDSLYRVVATGYGVEFEEVSVYPRTIIKEHYIEGGKASRWGLGVQAGYGATISGGTVKLSPYLGIGMSYNFLTY